LTNEKEFGNLDTWRSMPKSTMAHSIPVMQF
jgi:hypothetical protein